MILKNINSLISIIRYRLRVHYKQIPINRFININNKKIAKALNKNGYVVVSNFYSPKVCKKIINQINHSLKNKKKIWKSADNADKRIFGAEVISKEIKNFFLNKEIKNIAEYYCGFKIKNFMTMANKINSFKKNKGSGDGWHKDAYYNQFKSILYLNNVTKENGPFQVIPKSNKLINVLKTAYKLKKKYPNSRFSNSEIEMLYKKKYKTLEGQAGTLILVDTSTIHRGKPLTKGVRYALTNYYYPLFALKYMKNKFLPKFSL